MLTRSLWLAIGMHWAWNFFEGPLFGTPVSGYPRYANLNPLLTSTTIGPEQWTGGAFGPEGGLFSVIVRGIADLIFLILVVRQMRIARKNNNFVAEQPV